MKDLLPIARRRAGRAVAAVAAGLAALAITAGAAPAAVTLDWTQANVFQFAGPPNANKTWLGYVTSPAPPAGPGALGTATASGAASGDRVTPASASARGAGELYRFSYPAVGGAIETDALAGALDFDGALTFHSPAPPAGHGFTISVENPEIVLNGDDTGQLYASGVTSEGAGRRLSGRYVLRVVGGKRRAVVRLG